MLGLGVLVTIYLAGTVMAASVTTKQYYDLEDAENLFKDFLKQYKKTYNRKEYLERLEIFKESLIDINNRNAKYPSTVFVVNDFADLKPEELQQYRGVNLPLNGTSVKVKIPHSGVDAPNELDYRNQGLVSHVKNQANCGSCYIFSAIGNIEGQYARKHGQCIALSEGQGLDCLQCGTCNGGTMVKVMEEFAQKAGVMKEEDYPYVPMKGSCHEDPNNVVAHVLSAREIDTPTEEILKQTLFDIKGPLSVALNANDLFRYGGGILHPSACTGQPIDHAVLLVGYGEENGEQFWLIKNSWGEERGEHGYVRLLRGVQACGIGTKLTASAEVQ